MAQPAFAFKIGKLGLNSPVPAHPMRCQKAAAERSSFSPAANASALPSRAMSSLGLESYSRNDSENVFDSTLIPYLRANSGADIV
jgi:hypothetical protein